MTFVYPHDPGLILLNHLMGRRNVPLHGDGSVEDCTNPECRAFTLWQEAQPIQVNLHAEDFRRFRALAKRRGTSAEDLLYRLVYVALTEAGMGTYADDLLRSLVFNAQYTRKNH
jgi:hypothetical protein